LCPFPFCPELFYVLFVSLICHDRKWNTLEEDSLQDFQRSILVYYIEVSNHCLSVNTHKILVYIFRELIYFRGRCGRDRIVVGFITTYAISAYYHWCYEFESRSRRGVQHYVIKFANYMRQVCGFLRVLRFPPSIKLTATI
jgi:hypothetical protein